MSLHIIFLDQTHLEDFEEKAKEVKEPPSLTDYSVEPFYPKPPAAYQLTDANTYAGLVLGCDFGKNHLERLSL